MIMSVDLRCSDDDDDSERICLASLIKDLARSERSDVDVDRPLPPPRLELSGYATYLTTEPCLSRLAITSEVGEYFPPSSSVLMGSNPKKALCIEESKNKSIFIRSLDLLLYNNRSFSPSFSFKPSWIEDEIPYIFVDLSRTLSSVIAIALVATAELSSKENEPQQV